MQNLRLEDHVDGVDESVVSLDVGGLELGLIGRLGSAPEGSVAQGGAGIVLAVLDVVELDDSAKGGDLGHALKLLAGIDARDEVQLEDVGISLASSILESRHSLIGRGKDGEVTSVQLVDQTSLGHSGVGLLESEAVDGLETHHVQSGAHLEGRSTSTGTHAGRGHMEGRHGG